MKFQTSILDQGHMAAPSGNFPPSMLTQSTPLSFVQENPHARSQVGQVSLSESSELGNQFHGWNFVSIAAQNRLLRNNFPKMGVVRSIQRTEEAMISFRWDERQQIEHWRQNYSALNQGLDFENVDPVERHTFLDRLAQPNAEDSWGDFLEDVNIQLELSGIAYVWIVPNEKMNPNTSKLGVGQLVVVPSNQMEEVRSADTGELAAYRITNAANVLKGREFILPEEVCRIRTRSPLSRGMVHSATLAGLDWIETSGAVSRSRSQQMSNAGRPNFMLMPKDGSGVTIGDEKAKTIQRTIMERMSFLHQHGMPYVAPSNLDVVPMDTSPREMDYVESDQQLCDAIFALRGMNKIAAGMTKDASRSDTDNAMRAIAIHSIDPRLALIAEGLTRIARDRFDPRIVLWFGPSAKNDRESERADEQFDIENGIRTPEEIRVESRGLKASPDEGASKLWIKSSLVPVEQSAAEPKPIPDAIALDLGDDNEPKPKRKDDEEV